MILEGYFQTVETEFLDLFISPLGGAINTPGLFIWDSARLLLLAARNH